MALGISNKELGRAKKKYYGKFYVHDKHSRWEGEEKSSYNISQYQNISYLQKVINITLSRIYQIKYTLLNVKRKIFKYFSLFFGNKIEKKNSDFNINVKDEQIKNFSEELKKKDFLFIENFLSNTSYQYLLNSWPDINHFKHLKKVTKHYNVGFLYDHETSLLENTFNEYSKEFPLRHFYRFLLGDKFKNFYNKLFSSESKNYNVVAIQSTMATNDSYLIPHYDSTTHNNKIKKSYNFIYFIDGYDCDLNRSGATGIYRDNKFKEPIFIPNNIKNSVLIYNTKSSDFYHGFKNIECPNSIYRKTINIHSVIFEEN